MHYQLILLVPLPLLLLSVLLLEDMMNERYMRRKEDGLSDTKGQTYIFTNQDFRTQTMAACTWCGNCIVTLWAWPQEGDTVTTVTPNQPCTTLSNCVYAFTACSTVCTYGSRLSLFSLYCH